MAPEQKALVERGLAVANGYFRARLGRELPPLAVYIYADLEGIAAAYAQALSISIDDARRTWETSTAVAHERSIFFHVGNPNWSRGLKQYGSRSPRTRRSTPSRRCSPAPEHFPALTAVPIAGPRWLTEGSAEYIAFRAMAENGLAQLDSIRTGSWIGGTRSTSARLRALEVATGFVPDNYPYSISPLAVERLVSTSGDASIVSYYEAIGRGVQWQQAFQSAFGRTVDAYYEEFEAYRRGL